MRVLDQFIGELDALESKIALEGLTNRPHPERSDAFSYGAAVGRVEGVRLAKEALNRVLQDQAKAEKAENEPGRNQAKK